MRKLKLRKNPYKGKLIVFEGTDGAGKTTLISLTEKYLEEKYGIGSVLCVKQPTDMSRKTKLFQKMMYCKNHEDIDYRAVICDRYVYTSLANMLARGYRKEKWFFEAAKHLLEPDVAFLAYVEAEEAIRRIKSRPSECDRHLNEALLRGVADEFLKMAKTENFVKVYTKREAESAFLEVEERLDEEKGK